MTTANNLITAALQVVTSVTPGEPVDGTEAGAALTTLNRMLKAWSAKGLMIPFRTLESFTLTAGQASYTIGQTGSPNFNTVRPDEITFVFRREAANQDEPLDPWTKEQYNSVYDKAFRSQPLNYFYDTQFPNGVLYLYPAPDSAITLFVESLKPINQFATLQTTMQLPGEYEEAIVYLLAQRLAPTYGFSISSNPDIAVLVTDAERFIARKNIRRKVAQFDSGLLSPRPFDINAG